MSDNIATSFLGMLDPEMWDSRWNFAAIPSVS